MRYFTTIAACITLTTLTVLCASQKKMSPKSNIHTEKLIELQHQYRTLIDKRWNKGDHSTSLLYQLWSIEEILVKAGIKRRVSSTSAWETYLINNMNQAGDIMRSPICAGHLPTKEETHTIDTILEFDKARKQLETSIEQALKYHGLPEHCQQDLHRKQLTMLSCFKEAIKEIHHIRLDNQKLKKQLEQAIQQGVPPYYTITPKSITQD